MNAGKRPLHPRLRECALPVAVASMLAALLAASIPLANMSVPNWVYPSNPFNIPNIAFAWLAVFFGMWLLTAENAPHRFAGVLRRAWSRMTRRNAPKAAQDDGQARVSLPRLRTRLPFSWDRRSVLICMLLILAAWLPVLLITWPGGFSRDTVNMLYQFTTQGPAWYSATGTMVDTHFINHHPVFDTLICGFFYWLGSLTGNSAWGIFFFACATYVFASGVLGATVCYLHAKLGLCWGYAFASLLFLMFFPLFPLFFSYMSKDAIFVPWFLLWTLGYIEAWRTRGKALTVKFAILLCLVSAICILSKQTALYIMLASALALLVRVQGARMKAACAGVFAGALLVSLALFPAIVYPALGGVTPIGQQEALGTPLNQTVSLYLEHPDSFSDQDLQTVNRVIKLNRAVRDYKEFSVDGVKDRWRTKEATAQDTMAFLALWIQKGLTAQGASCYFDSTARICAAFFVPASGLSAPNFLPPRKIQAFARSVDKAGGDFVDLRLKQPKTFKDNRAAMDGAIAQTVQTPFVGMFFTIGLYSGFIPLMCLVALIAQRKRAEKGAVLALLPVIVLLLIQVVSPVAFTRYAMPFVVGAPLMVGVTVALLRGQTARSGRGGALRADAVGEGACKTQAPGETRAATPPLAPSPLP
ncbi:MAG: DUF6020 family protein [Eggerthellaceae bacterium]|jgi:hypothetical protein